MRGIACCHGCHCPVRAKPASGTAPAGGEAALQPRPKRTEDLMALYGLSKWLLERLKEAKDEDPTHLAQRLSLWPLGMCQTG